MSNNTMPAATVDAALRAVAVAKGAKMGENGTQPLARARLTGDQ